MYLLSRLSPQPRWQEAGDTPILQIRKHKGNIPGRLNFTGSPDGNRDHLLLSDQVEERILLSLGVRLAVSFLHPGSVLSVMEKHDFHHVSFIHL